MSITINGATNTLTAASGLTIAGNTAVTGTLSATGKISTSSSAGGRVISAENDTNTNQTQMQVSNTNGRYEAGVLTSGWAYAGSITAGASFQLYANNTAIATVSSTGLAVAGTLSATGALSLGEGGGGGFLGVPIDTGYMRIHGSNAINQGAGIILFGTTSAAPNTGRLTAAASTVVQWTSTGLTPGADNTYNFGSASLGWKELFCDNGTINTSDARRKTEVSALSAAEINAAKQLAKEIGSFKFLAAVAEKGDAARKHIGMTVQRAIEIMEANGLDPFAYSFICYDAWDQQVIKHPAVEAVAAQDAVLDEEGNVVTHAVAAVEAKDAWTEVTEAGDKYSFRAHELLLFMAAGFEARLSALEAA